ncbi:hypothetical protein KR018_008501, partial [Drosophila ironensis]
MFEFIRRLSIPQLNAKILHWIFRYAQFLGIVLFRLDGNQISNHKWMLCLGVIIRLTNLAAAIYTFSINVGDIKIYIMQIIYSIRLYLAIQCNLIIVVLQLFRETETINLFKRFLNLFQKIRIVGRRRTRGFGTSRELWFILICVMSMIHDLLYRFTFGMPKNGFISTFKILCMSYIVVETSMMLHVHLLAYLCFGILYSELNEYILKDLQPKLLALNEGTDRRTIRKVQRKLEKCYNLHREIFKLKMDFSKLFQLPMVLAFLHKITLVGLVSFDLIVLKKCQSLWLSILIAKYILDLLLMTLSIEKAQTQFSKMRRLHFD